MPSAVRLFVRSFERWPWQILIGAWLGTLTFGFWAWHVQNESQALSRSFWDTLYSALGLFTMNIPATAYPMVWQLNVVRFVAPLVAAFTAVTAIGLLALARVLPSAPAVRARPHRRLRPRTTGSASRHRAAGTRPPCRRRRTGPGQPAAQELQGGRDRDRRGRRDRASRAASRARRQRLPRRRRLRSGRRQRRDRGRDGRPDARLSPQLSALPGPHHGHPALETAARARARRRSGERVPPRVLQHLRERRPRPGARVPGLQRRRTSRRTSSSSASGVSASTSRRASPGSGTGAVATGRRR